MIRKAFVFIVLMSAFLFSSCGNQNYQEISFEGFTMRIDLQFKEIDGSLVENNQIKNKIIKSYYMTKANDFRDNIIISKTNVDENISAEKFGELSNEKILNELVGFKVIESGTVSIKCGGNAITIPYYKYSIQNNIFDNESQIYYMTINTVKLGGNGYILSYMATSEKTLDSYSKATKTLSCE